MEGDAVRIFVCFALAILAWGTLSISAGAQTKKQPAEFPDQVELEKMAARFAPTPLRVEILGLSSGDRQALVKLIEAARILNDIYMQQLWEGNAALYARLQKDTSVLGKARLNYFWINKGPWSDIDQFKAFLPDVPPRKPLGANFYPEDMSKDAFEGWVAQLSPKEQDDAKSFFTIIRWRVNTQSRTNNLLAI